MYVDWEYYKIFYYVAKYQNFTKAARVLGNNQPNITHSMNRLESQLNCVLFIRSNRGVTLTPEGEMLYSRIASAAVQIQDAEEELSASATLEHGAICISATETALNIYLSEKLRAFHTEYPGIRLRISNHSTPQALQAVKNGEVDFAIISTPAEVEPGLKLVELKSFYEVLVGGRTFTALASQSLTLKELSNYPLISLSDESMTRSFYRQFFLDHDAVLRPDTEAATTDQMLTLVKSELGLAFVPEPMAKDLLARGELVQLHLQEIIPTRSICLVYDHHRPLNTAARKFQQMMTKADSPRPAASKQRRAYLSYPNKMPSIQNRYFTSLPAALIITIGNSEKEGLLNGNDISKRRKSRGTVRGDPEKSRSLPTPDGYLQRLAGHGRRTGCADRECTAVCRSAVQCLREQGSVCLSDGDLPAQYV